MELLPKSSKEFSSKQYWNEFFSKRGSKSFEWYGEYTELCGLLHKYIRPSDKVLVSGCGSSSISADLYKVGYRQIINVDISEIVINQMTKKYAEDCPQMKWIHGDMHSLSFEADSISCILDKGTLDALMSDKSEKNVSEIFNYFTELGRVLKIGGRYICISLLQEHILATLTEWFPLNGWIMRFCRCEDAEKAQSESGSFSLPVFIVICTKFRKLDNTQPIIELSLQEGNLHRVKEVSEVKAAITSLQQFAVLRHNLRTKTVAGENMKLDLCDPKTGHIRYSLFIVDAPKASKKFQFAVFIVPHGRETEWLFSNVKGQQQLAESASSNRLVITHLMRDHVYGTMKDIQDELSSKVLELAPSNLPNHFKVPFLSVGTDLGERIERFRGRSKLSGEFIVEDVKIDSTNYFLRRLIFLNNQSVIQSEAKILPACGKKRKVSLKSVIDPSYLACNHHSVMLLSLELVSHSSSVLLIGLGGGALGTFIHKYFPKVKLKAVDVDENIVDVAKKWYNFTTDSRLSCIVEDGIDYIEKTANEGGKYDIVMFDIDSKDTSEGLSCPPRQFIEKCFLDKVASCVAEEGMFVLNFVCRDDQLKDFLIQELRTVFPTIIGVAIPEEVNIILFCQCTCSSGDLKTSFFSKINDLNLYLKKKLCVKVDVINFEDIVNNVKFYS